MRDKLLSRKTGDIDIAIRYSTGARFAHRLHAFAEARSTEYQSQQPFVHSCQEYVPAVSSVAEIASNPSMSRHLETATVRLDGMDLDFVQLRTEDYASAAPHRVPSVVAAGTPKEDSYRRDFTVNALYYNLQTQCVEDFTGHGLDDLKSGVLRTPLEPVVTLLDDPLRALRALRFSCCLQFSLCSELQVALSDKRMHEALLRKVSCERIGIEVLQIVLSGQCVHGLRMIARFRLVESIFKGVFSHNEDDSYKAGVQCVDNCLVVLRDNEAFLSDQNMPTLPLHGRKVLIFAALLCDSHNVSALKGALRQDKKTMRDVQKVGVLSTRLHDIAVEWKKVVDISGSEHIEKELWIEVAEILREAGDILWIAVSIFCGMRMRDPGLLRKLVESGICPELCRESHAFDGQRIQYELGLKRGPEVGRALRELMRIQLWYYRKHDGKTRRMSAADNGMPNADDCMKILKHRLIE